jgi:succinate dehydrogenase / fumarate reductase flavoprotein subunit
VFGQRAGEYAAKFAKDNGPAMLESTGVDEAARLALAPFEKDSGENAFNIQHDLQDIMQELCGIVRQEAELQRAVVEVAKLRERADKVGCPVNREYNPGWHTALDLDSLLIVSQAVAMSAIDRKESRGGHFRDDFPKKEDAFGKHNTFIRKGPSGEMVLSREPIAPMPDELKQIIEQEQK